MDDGFRQKFFVHVGGKKIKKGKIKIVCQLMSEERKKIKKGKLTDIQ